MAIVPLPRYMRHMTAQKASQRLQIYAIGLGSNRRHAIHGDPRKVLAAALDAMESEHVELLDASAVMASAPVGPSRRRYANAAALAASSLSPPEMLSHLKSIESQFGKRIGQRWSARTLDLDILLWSEGIWADAQLKIPHPQMAKRDFVLTPLAELAPKWRHPLLQKDIFQILSQLLRRNPVDQWPTSH